MTNGEHFITFQDFKVYSTTRNSIRINCCGMKNTRITKLRFRQIKGFRKQLINLESTLTDDLRKELLILEKEIIFRQMCLDMKSVFSIEIR